MRALIFLMLMMLCSFAFAKEGEILTFKQWKSEKIQSALSQVVEFKSKSLVKNKIGPVTSEEAMRLSQLEFNLEVTKDLGVHDYVDIYLKSQDISGSSLRGLAARMSPDEVAEILVLVVKSPSALSSNESMELKIADDHKDL